MVKMFFIGNQSQELRSVTRRHRWTHTALSLGWYSIYLPGGMEGWDNSAFPPSLFDLGGRLHTKMVYLPAGSHGVFTWSSKRPALARVFWIHLLSPILIWSKIVHETYWAETETRPRRSKFCSRRDQDETLQLPRRWPWSWSSRYSRESREL